MAEVPCQGSVVPVLHPVGDVALAGNLLLHLAYDGHVEQGYDDRRHHQGNHQVDGDGRGEDPYGISGLALQGEEYGEEDGADAYRGQKHGPEILLHALYGCLHAAHAASQILQIAVYDHDAVVHNHAQHHDEACQGDDVQFYAHGIHDTRADEGGQGYGEGCHHGASDGEEHYHYGHDDDHGDEQVAQEVAHAGSHHLGLVGDAAHLHVLGQAVLAELVQYLVHLLAEHDYVVALQHFQRQDDATLAVGLYVAVAQIVFPLHRGNVAHAHRLAVWRGEDDALADFLFGTDGRSHVYVQVLLRR